MCWDSIAIGEPWKSSGDEGWDCVGMGLWAHWTYFRICLAFSVTAIVSLSVLKIPLAGLTETSVTSVSHLPTHPLWTLPPIGDCHDWHWQWPVICYSQRTDVVFPLNNHHRRIDGRETLKGQLWQAAALGDNDNWLQIPSLNSYTAI